MKLKLEKEVQAVIDAIVKLPDTSVDNEAFVKPTYIIIEFDRDLMKQRGSLPVKHWVKLRLQLSFLYEFFHISAEVEKKLNASKADEDSTKTVKSETYRALMRMFKDVASGQLLQRPEMVRMAMNYGVLYLSDYEVQKLVDGNKV